MALATNGTLPIQQPEEAHSTQHTLADRCRDFFTSKIYHWTVIALVSIDL